MRNPSPTPIDADRLAKQKARLAVILERALELFEGGATGAQTASYLSQQMDQTLVGLLDEHAAVLGKTQKQLLDRHACVIAVGGSGRRELAPFSDTDLLFLYRNPAACSFQELCGEVVRACWDAGAKPGHSLRTVAEAVAMGRQDVQAATALVEARLLWGSQSLFDAFQRQARRRVFASLRSFIEACRAGRIQEREQFGDAVNQLEPDVKRSKGGLRDVHLIRWIGYARYGVADIESLRLRGVLAKNDAHDLRVAYEFLLRIRIDMHFHAGRAQDVLSRDEQLRLAKARGVCGSGGRRPVEVFMQTYFRHSMAISRIARRFLRRSLPDSLAGSVIGRLTAARFDDIYLVRGGAIDVVRRHRDRALGSVRQILQLYRSCLYYSAELVPKIVDAITELVPRLEPEMSRETGLIFRDILRDTGNVGGILRNMYLTGVLEVVVPEMAHAYGLLQFNQYHSYTVDEHTFRAIEATRRFQSDDGPVGAAWRAVRHKASLTLALLLHDIGKGYDEDHSSMGARIAKRVAERLQMSDHKRMIVVFLVRHHLQMSHLAFRRDITDVRLLVEFARQVGSPERLRYVLTAADIQAVGPGVWTDWKAELLADLYNRTMYILSGRPYSYLEKERLQSAREHVWSAIVPVSSESDNAELHGWIERQLEVFPAHYLMRESPDRIAQDLDIIRRLQPEDIVVDGQFHEDTGTVDYRIITSGRPTQGCFHRIAGVLSAHYLQILSAHICTTTEGVVVDDFRVADADFADGSPRERTDSVCAAIRAALTGERTVEEMFRSAERFRLSRDAKPVSDLPTRVIMDNDSSENYTVIDVFAHDRHGLLYVLTRAMFRMELSVALAKIATHFDQIVDVFYVTDAQGSKLPDGASLACIRDELHDAITRFQDAECVVFNPG